MKTILLLLSELPAWIVAGWSDEKMRRFVAKRCGGNK